MLKRQINTKNKQKSSQVINAFVRLLACSICFAVTPVVAVSNTAPIAVINYLLQGTTTTQFTGTDLLNDTGITACSDGSNNGLACPVTSYPEQDAEYGRDVTYNDNSNGHAAFDFTKLDSTGQALPANANQWFCVKDNVTGLIWEVKTDEGGLRDKDHTYTWYNPTGVNDGGSAGTRSGGICFQNGSCDTYSYVQKVNEQGLCGKNDWRLPITSELESLLSFDRFTPSIDIAYFPNTQSSSYWSASPYASHSDYAWFVYFYYGSSHNYYKSSYDYVRLVRTGQ